MTKRVAWTDSRLILGVVAALAVALAAYVLGTQKSIETPAFAPQVMFPDLRDELDSVDRLSVRSKDGAFDIIKTAQGAWLIPQISNYPAAPGKVRAALLALSDLQLVEPKTARPGRYPALGLGAPADGGLGVDLGVWAGETELAHVIIGKRQGVAKPGTPALIYVRSPAAPQTWAARGRLDVGPLPINWIDKSVLGIGREDIAAFDVRLPDGTAYRLARAKPDEADVMLLKPPKGRTPAPSYTLNATAFAAADLLVDDVKPAGDVDFGPDASVTRVVVTTFDGLAVKLSLVKQGQTYWMKGRAEAVTPPLKAEEKTPVPVPDDTAPAAAEQAKHRVAALNQTLAGWAYAIAKYKYDQMTKPLEALLAAKPKPE